MASSGQTELSRTLGFFPLFATAAGTMIGAGIFVLPGVAAEAAGPGAALSFLFAGLIAAIAALSVSELATAMPKAGGGYYYVSRAMGPALGAIVGLGAWLALTFKGSFALVGLGQYVQHFTPMPVIPVALGVGALLIGVNLTGARITGMLQNTIVVALLAILGVFVARGMFAIEREVLEPLVPFGWGAVFATTGLVFISYLGIEKAAAVAEEVIDPGRTIPRAILASVAVVTFLYVGVMLVVTGVLPITEVAALPAPVAEAGIIFLGATGGAMVAVAGLLATASTGNAAILSSSRYPFAMARDGLMEPWFNRISPRFGTPDRAIWVTGGVMLGLVVLFDVEQLAKLGGVFNIFVFALVNLAVVILRRVRPPWYRPVFRAPFQPWLQIAGSLAALALIPQMGLGPALAAAGFLAAGVGWYYWCLRRWGKEAIRPSYGFFDYMERIRQIQSIEQLEREPEAEPAEEAARSTGVVVEIVPHQPNKHLLTVAASLARRWGCTVDAVIVTVVPPQAPLEEAVRQPSTRLVQRLRRRVEEHGAEFRFHHVVARDQASGILSLVDERTCAVLIDWHERFRRVMLRRSHVNEVLRKSPVRVAVLKYRGHKRYDRVLVTTAGGPYARAEVEMADAIAERTGARIRLLMVLPDDASDARQAHGRDYLARLRDLTTAETDVRVALGESVIDEILREGADCDLIVIGASRQPLFTQYLFGRIPEQIAEATDRSVLVTKDPGFPQIWTRRFTRVLELRRRPRHVPTPLPED
jgi:amino acid transporter/nucleotide-binding universal stress UspA family protein